MNNLVTTMQAYLSQFVKLLFILEYEDLHKEQPINKRSTKMSTSIHKT
ncbi:hypothetical protein [Halalkalibacter krulwichiae]|uniref:Uncharacterized protein n=1 Tax=Halalkalibacter krulwichiae TaxID=199441 RepID=A0A1X9MH66_9BACI|nr:hypothetical protein [Halalkalibacter krulwichiae]ARK31473.1 hypothetical protein BkAM31D_17400 [Halalkalibacter krulwichiae]